MAKFSQQKMQQGLSFGLLYPQQYTHESCTGTALSGETEVPTQPFQTETRQLDCVLTKLKLNPCNAKYCRDRGCFAASNTQNFLALCLVFVVPENISPYKSNAIFNSDVLQIVF